MFHFNNYGIMKKIILYTLVMAGLLTSCTKEEFVEKQTQNKSGDELFFVANTDNSSETKTTLDGLNILWTAADPVMVFGIGSDSNPKVAGYAAHASGATADLDWTTNISGTEGAFVTGETPQYALYPTDATNASISGSVITFKLPETQTYAANSFGSGANVSVGKVKTGEGIADINFKNVCGYLKLQVSVPSDDAATVGKIVLTTKGSEKLWGTFTADASLDAPVAAYKSGAADGSTSVTLNCPDGVAVSTDASNPTIFYIVVPVGSLADGFIAEVYSKQDHLMTTMETTKDISIVRNQVNRMPNKTFAWLPASYTESYYVANDGQAMIKTDIVPSYNMDFNIHVGMEFTTENYGTVRFFGAQDSDAIFELNLVFNWYTNKYGERLYQASAGSRIDGSSAQNLVKGSIYQPHLKWADRDRFHFILSYKETTSSLEVPEAGYEWSITNGSDRVTTAPIGLFGRTTPASGGCIDAPLKIYDYSVSEDGDMIRLYIPCHNGEEYGLYDVFTSTFFAKYLGPGSITGKTE